MLGVDQVVFHSRQLGREQGMTGREVLGAMLSPVGVPPDLVRNRRQ
jgi:hypothetical protein